MDPVTTADRERVGQDPPGTYAGNDFMNLFRPNAPWTRTASMIQVYGVSTQFLHRSTDDQLSTVINDLRRRHIALGMSGEIMQASQCSQGIPGFSGIDVWRTVVDRVVRMGGKIDYVEFDEPVAFAHYNIMQKNTACKYTIEELVRNIAPQIQVIKTAFPDVKFGDGEPVNGLTIGKMDDNLQFAKIFRQTGARLSFMDADIIWYEPTFRSQLVEWRRRLHEAGILYGAYINGSPCCDKTDLQWTQHAIERYGLVTNDPAIKPDNYIFGTWMPHPSRYLPETQPGTLTSVIVQTVGKQAK